MRDILNDIFPLGEETISQNSKYSYDYATDVLKAPWPKGEEIIGKFTQCLLL